MIYNYKKENVELAQQLRKNMTPEEKHLWYDFLKKLPVTVNRQKNIGDFIIDFFIAKYRIAIEVDGRQHKMPAHEQEDRLRDRDLDLLGIKVLRYTNKQINNTFNEVCKDILKHLGLSFEDLK